MIADANMRDSGTDYPVNIVRIDQIKNFDEDSVIGFGSVMS